MRDCIQFTATFAEGPAMLPDAVLEVVPVPVLTLDAEGRVTRWNRAVADLTNIPAAHMLGRVFEGSVLTPADADLWSRECAASAAAQAPVEFAVRWKMGDGSMQAVRCVCATLRGPDGSFGGTICSAGRLHDIRLNDVAEARGAELNALGRFVHDTIAQNLVALSFQLAKIEARLQDPAAREMAVSAQELVDRCCQDIRAIGYMIAPFKTTGNQIEQSIERYAASITADSACQMVADLDPVSQFLSVEGRSIVIDAVQTAASCGLVERSRNRLVVRLRSCHIRILLELEMTGFEAACHGDRWAVIRERTRAAGGEFTIAARTGGECPDPGMTIRISLPEMMES